MLVAPFRILTGTIGGGTDARRPRQVGPSTPAGETRVCVPGGDEWTSPAGPVAEADQFERSRKGSISLLSAETNSSISVSVIGSGLMTS